VPGNACETVLTRSGLKVLDERSTNHAELMFRVERVCDLRLTLELASSSLLAISINGVTAAPCTPARHASFVVPQRSIRAGVNVLAFEKKRFEPRDPWADPKTPGTVLKDPRADVRSLTIDPICEPAR
jgi:hypothetical protein